MIDSLRAIALSVKSAGSESDINDERIDLLEKKYGSGISAEESVRLEQIEEILDSEPRLAPLKSERLDRIEKGLDRVEAAIRLLQAHESR